MNSRNSKEITLPVLEERISVQKSAVETGRIRLHKTVETKQQIVDEPLLEDTYDVERVAVDRVIAEPLEPRYEGDTLVLPVVEEVLVVEKRLILKEEIRVTRKRRDVRNPRTQEVRKENVRIERVPSSR